MESRPGLARRAHACSSSAQSQGVFHFMAVGGKPVGQAVASHGQAPIAHALRLIGTYEMSVQLR
jgi:hypothetical protein